jgi:hypothetical protein
VFASQLGELEELGFTDRARNIAALKQTNGMVVHSERFSCIDALQTYRLIAFVCLQAISMLP